MWMTLSASAVLAAAAWAHAEVKGSAPDSLLVVHSASARAAPGAVYQAIGRVGEWWDDQHTWSGSARNMSLELRAGGCFCETWNGGSVEHGHVVLAQRDDTVRLDAALGPIQELAASAVLTFKLTTTGSAVQMTQITLTYRVSGDETHELDKIAGIVDAVLGEQLARLVRFVETGRAKQ